LEKESLEDRVSKQVTVDGISMKKITKSSFIRSAFLKDGYNLPKSRKGVMKLVHAKYNEVKDLYRKRFAEFISANERFSFTCDEYTSLRNKRYMNISVKINSDVSYLGMIRMEGSYPAERCLQLIIVRLNDFGLDLNKDVLGFCTDGASVMVKLGKI
jgi:hypothetical protein